MRAHVLVRRSRSLIKAPAISHRALLSSTRPQRFPRKNVASSPSNPRLSKRSSSSVTAAAPGPPHPEEEPTETVVSEPRIIDQLDPGEPLAEEDPDKPKRRLKSLLPSGLNILWSPDIDPNLLSSTASTTPFPNSALPPPEVFHEALTNLHIAFHPQSQYRGTFSTNSSPLVEPTLALYCPIEGGDYIIDETVRELGRQTGAEVVVLDAVQLAAGECGQFGKAASVLQLPENPLHFPSSPPSPQSSSRSLPLEEEDEEEFPQAFMPYSQVTLHVLAPSRSRGRAALLSSSSRSKGTSGMAKLKSFFDELINISAPISEGSTDPPRRRPRIIYIRDFPTLAASSANWYPALLASVRSRRQGPLSKTSSPVFNPTTIVFGVTPSIVAPAAVPPGPTGPANFMNMLMARAAGGGGSPTPNSRPNKSDYSEDEAADKAREKRLRERLRKWERGDASLQEDLPRLFTSAFEGEDNGTSNGNPEVVFIGGAEGMPLMPSGSVPTLATRRAQRGDSPDPDRSSRFFRTSVIVPSVRSVILEKACRMNRRREINELTMRMGVGSVGGFLDKMESTPDDPLDTEGTEDALSWKMWDEWGKIVEVWSNVRQIADRVVGRAVATHGSHSLDATPVYWPEVYEAWANHNGMRDSRKLWVQQSTKRVLKEEDEVENENEDVPKVDEVIERVKRDAERGDLDQHEQRLVGCIVDAASMSTTFNQVHLPANTIDAIRTIVSLPLLHPSSFQLGILKEHAMTGCLLFGPPGTGKTLVVRALAKEAGCRMLAISPSDVMDMYVGEAEKLVRSVFSLARRLAPCVVFIDEIDALFGARSSREAGGGDHAHRGVITEFMQEMDGLKSSKDDNIMVIGATNRPFDLDDAVLRRLPRRLLVDLPGEKEREAILKILLRDETLGSDVDLKKLAHNTESFSGSDLKHLCVAAALDAVKERVEVPWRPSLHQKEDGPSDGSENIESPLVAERTEQIDGTAAAAATEAEPPADTANTETGPGSEEATRTLYWRNFAVALREITPSSSEVLGSLADLRKWNQEFGEGRKERKKQVWGKGRFGFTVQALETGESRVQPQTAASTGSDTI